MTPARAPWHRWLFQPEPLFGIALLGLAVYFALGAYAGFRDEWNLFKHGRSIDAEITDITNGPDHFRGEEWRMLTLNLTRDRVRIGLDIVLTSGQRLRLYDNVTLAQSQALTTGQRLTVRYMPADPTLVELRKGERAERGFIQALFAATALAAGLAIVIFSWLGLSIIDRPTAGLGWGRGDRNH